MDNMLHSFNDKKDITHLCLMTSEQASDLNSSDDDGERNMSEDEEEAEEDIMKF